MKTFLKTLFFQFDPPTHGDSSKRPVEASSGLPRDFKAMRTVKIVPDDDSTVYIFLVVGIVIGIIVGVLI